MRMSSDMRCGECSAAIEDEKYRCTHCGRFVCRIHRGKNKGLFSTSYYCIPSCAATRTATGPAAAPATEASHAGPRFYAPPPPPNRPPSMSALRGKTQILQTSFGLIQEADGSPPKDDGGVAVGKGAASLVGVGVDGGDVPVAIKVPDRHRGGTISSSGGGGSTSATSTSAPVYYNHRGELQELTTTAPSSTHASTSTPAGSAASHSRTAQPRGQVPSGDLAEGAVPMRPPPSLLISGPSSASSSTSLRHSGTARVHRVGVPLPAPEPCNPTTGKRHVLIGPDMPIEVIPEDRVRFVEVELTAAPNAAVRGTVLGTDGDYVVWHERGKRYAQRLTPADYKSMIVVVPARCKHCGAILPRDEADEHVASHKKGGGVELGTTVGDENLGTACGDTAILLRLIRVKQLGSGAQGDVWLCRDGDVPANALPTSRSSNGQPPPGWYVQKDIQCSSDKDAVQKYQQSVRLMTLSNVHIISYLAVQRHPKLPLVTVLMPYYPEGDLAALIRAQREPFSEHYLCSLLLQLASALHFLHTRVPSVIHGDIKPENVLLFNSREQIVLMDLDASKELVGHQRETSVQLGTSAWMAPEAFHLQQSSTKSDIWSLGLVMYVLAALPDFPMLPCDATGSNELLNSSSWAMEELLKRVGSRIVGRGYSRDFALLAVRMLHHDPKRRPAAADIVESVTNLMTAQLVGGSAKDSAVAGSAGPGHISRGAPANQTTAVAHVL